MSVAGWSAVSRRWSYTESPRSGCECSLNTNNPVTMHCGCKSFCDLAEKRTFSCDADLIEGGEPAVQCLLHQHTSPVRSVEQWRA